MRHWMRDERERALRLVEVAARRADALGTRPGANVLRLFTRSIRRFAMRRFERLYPGLGLEPHVARLA